MDAASRFVAKQLSCVRDNKLLFTDLSFELSAQEALLITGANGSGKSSLLRLLSGLITPHEGEIYWDKKPIQQNINYPENLHYLGHTNGIKLGLTVKENLRLTQSLNQIHVPSFDTVLNSLALLSYQDTPAKHLSAGQKRRIALAKLFLFPKPLWILDEPLTALDAQTQTFFLTQLETHLQNGGIAIISSHHPIELNLKEIRLGTC